MGRGRLGRAGLDGGAEGRVESRETMRGGEFFHISAQNQGDSGSVTGTVEVDGKVVKTTTSTGGYVIASCSGSV